MSKLLLYCTKEKKQKDLLWSNNLKHFFLDGAYNRLIDNLPEYLLNGKIVAECDFEVEKIYYSPMFCNYTTWSLGKDELLNKSCLTHDELKNYLGTKDVIGNNGYNGYAIHIKNLHIFDKPRELSEYDNLQLNPLIKAPQNMCYVYERDGVSLNFLAPTFNEKYILISIRPEWLCKILNGEKTIEVRKKVLKEML